MQTPRIVNLDRDKENDPSPRPEVSVVVPMFQEEENIDAVLARFIESLDSQRRSWEMICVNDACFQAAPLSELERRQDVG